MLRAEVTAGWAEYCCDGRSSRCSVRTNTSRSEVNKRLLSRFSTNFESVGSAKFESQMTHIIGAEHLSIRRVLQQQALKSQHLTKSFLSEWRECFCLEFIDVIIPDNVLENSINFVEDLDPGIEIGARPFPGVDLA